MAHAISKVTTWVLALIVVLGLSFGASQLFAGERSICEGYDGTCSSQEECETLCRALYPENGGAGHCDPNGCCTCAVR